MKRYNVDVRQLDHSYIRNRNARIEECEDGSRKLITLERNVAEDFEKWLNEYHPDGLECEKVEFEKERNRWVVYYKKR